MSNNHQNTGGALDEANVGYEAAAFVGDHRHMRRDGFEKLGFHHRRGRLRRQRGARGTQRQTCQRSDQGYEMKAHANLPVWRGSSGINTPGRATCFNYKIHKPVVAGARTAALNQILG